MNRSWLDELPSDLVGRVAYVDGALVSICLGCGGQRRLSCKRYVLEEVSSGKIEKFRLCGDCGTYKGFKPTKKDRATWPDGHKRCGTCKEIKPFSDFHKHSAALFGYNTICKKCRLPISKSAYAGRSVEQRLYDSAKSRANKKHREFSIELDDIRIPERCPILGIEISGDRKSWSAASLDRIDSDKGYVKGNVMVVSRRANMLKNNMTLEEARLVTKHLERVSGQCDVSSFIKEADKEPELV